MVTKMQMKLVITSSQTILQERMNLQTYTLCPYITSLYTLLPYITSLQQHTATWMESARQFIYNLYGVCESITPYQHSYVYFRKYSLSIE